MLLGLPFLYIILMLVLLLIWFNHYMCFVIDITSDCGPCTYQTVGLAPPRSSILADHVYFIILPWLEKLNLQLNYESGGGSADQCMRL